MVRSGHGWMGVLIVATLLAACAAPQAPTPNQSSSSADAVRPAAPKRITVVTMGEPPTLSTKINTAGAGGVVPGADALEELLSAGLVRLDPKGNLLPQLAEAVPTLENGLWKLLPDGRMETTWRLKPGVTWHDGTPLTTDDLLFSARVGQDREVGVFNHLGYASVERVEAVDPRTVTVHWSQPYVGADTMFSAVFPSFALPLPSHLLEAAYRDEKAAFLDLPYWSQGFIGAGPYRLRDWQRGSYLMLSAHESYVLGRPKIDEIEVRLIPDNQTLATNLLTGTIDLTLGRTLSLEQAMQVRDQWPDGRVETTLRSWITIYPQMLNPTPAVVGDVRFRRALMHAIDRQQLVDSLQAGQVPIAHSYVSPAMAEFQEIDRAIVHYDFDPARATQMIEALGSVKGSDGFFRDSANQRLSVELRTTADNDIHRATVLPIADGWQRIGVGVETNIIPIQRQRDREYRANSPAFEMLQQGNDLPSLATHHSREIPLPQNDFTGRSKNRYRNAEFDGLVERFYVTIPRPERTQVLSQIAHHITDQLTMIGLYYLASPTLMRNTVRNADAGGDRATQAWNAHEWDVEAGGNRR